MSSFSYPTCIELVDYLTDAMVDTEFSYLGLDKLSGNNSLENISKRAALRSCLQQKLDDEKNGKTGLDVPSINKSRTKCLQDIDEKLNKLISLEKICSEISSGIEVLKTMKVVKHRPASPANSTGSNMDISDEEMENVNTLSNNTLIINVPAVKPPPPIFEDHDFAVPTTLGRAELLKPFVGRHKLILAKEKGLADLQMGRGSLEAG